MLLHPKKYAILLGEKIEKYHIDVYLINTGWIGGPYGVGQRVELSYTRAMVNAAISGSLKDCKFYRHPIFGFLIPEEVSGVPKEILNPRNLWDNGDRYDEEAIKLKEKIQHNYEKYQQVASV